MRRTIATFPLLALFLVISWQTARASWTVDGAPVCTAAADQVVPATIPDGAGGAIVVWHDVRSGPSNIYVQRVNASGDPQWTADGVALCTAPIGQGGSALVSDGAGGAIVTWHDHRNGFNFDIYVQWVNASGVPQWSANGVALCTATDHQINPMIVSDGAGGAVVTWQDARSGADDIYAQRVSASGVPQWTTDGVGLCTAIAAQAFQTIAADGAGGAIVAWYDTRNSSEGDIYAQRVNPSGVPQWAANGVAICTVANSQVAPAIVSDGGGGAIIAWLDDRYIPNTDIYAQRVSASGVPQWTPQGVALCSAPNDQGPPHVFSDGAGGAVVTWDDPRSGNADIYVQRVDASGLPLWTADGVAVCTAVFEQGSPSVVSDGAGGAIVTWHDLRDGSTYDVYAQLVNSSGATEWQLDGVALSTAANSQSVPVIASDGAGGAIVAWHDARNGSSNRDIYAQRIANNGHAFSFTVTTTAEDYVTGTLWEAITQANSTPGSQVIRFNIPGSGPHVINAYCLPFPSITEELTIDGFTQPGSSPNTNPVGSPSDAQINVEISGPWWGLGWPGVVFQASGTLRGVAISGFDASVEVQEPNVVIEGCYIGTDASGLVTGPHQQRYGVRILTDKCCVGGSSPAARNVISNSYEDGIRIHAAAGSEIYGNYIGVGADAAVYLPNGYGIHALNGATNSQIGSSVIETFLNPSEANLIVSNYKAVVVEGSTSDGNAVIGNFILDNPLGSIDLGGYPNDANDADTGPNEQQNYPDLSSAIGNEIAGTMMGAPSQYIYLHFYWSPHCCGNAAHYVGGTTAFLDGSGSAPFTFALTQSIPPGSFINATATDVFGNTSEVSFPVVYQNTPSGPDVPVDLVDASGNVRGTATFDNVTGAGNTVLTTPFTPPSPLSGGFYAGNPNDPAIYFDVTTDAAYTGTIEVCFFYDDSNLPGPESDLELVHYNGSIWQAVTSSQDEVNNIICGIVTTLSPFVIAVSTAVSIGDQPLPSEFALHANIPNPFNPVTTIRFDVPDGGADVNISIYDVAGRMVRELVDEHRGVGTWSVQWNGDDDRGRHVASGVYFYRMHAGSFVDTRKMVLLK